MTGRAAARARMTQSSSVAASARCRAKPGTTSGRSAGTLVDDGEPRVDRGAVPGIDGAVDRRGEHDASALLQADEGVAPGRIVGREARAGDGDKPSAVGEPRQRGSDMAERRIGHAPLDMRRRRERRVHQNDGRRDARVEMIVDMRGVEAG